MILEAQFTENIEKFKDRLKEEKFQQNFDVFRLPIFRNEAQMLEKVLIRGNEDGSWHIENPHIRAYSFAFAMFGLAETTELSPDIVGKEIWAVAEAMLQVKIPRESAGKDELELLMKRKDI